MLRIVIIGFVIIASAFSLYWEWAEAATYREITTKILRLNHTLEPTRAVMRRTLDQVTPVLVDQIDQALRADGKARNRREIETFVYQFQNRFTDRMMEEIEPFITAQYRRHYSIKELEAAVKIMEHPDYQAFVEKNPEIIQGAMRQANTAGKQIASQMLSDMAESDPLFRDR